MRTLTPLALLAALTAGATATPNQPATNFGAKLHAQVGKKPGNLIYSPSSIAIALAMTREGATGTTASEMDAVLGSTAGADAKALAKRLLAGKGKKDDGPEIALANRLFGDSKTPFVKRFLDITRTDYDAPIEGVDFRTKSEQARVKINDWVAQQTRDRIKDLIAPGILDDTTRLVLVNAIYLKAKWQTPFEPNSTRPGKFAVDGAKAPKVVPMMNGAVSASWGTHAGARTLDLPYRAASGGPKLSMLIIVPDGSAKLDAIEASYAKDGIAGFLKDTSKSGLVTVAMPKFKVGSEFDLGEQLKAMGMKRAFLEGSAQFDGITTAASLYISKVIHKAWIEVDEAGTEAAAATAVVMNDESAAMPSAQFHVDRSFTFFIHDENGTVLFGGRVNDPSQR